MSAAVIIDWISSIFERNKYVIVTSEPAYTNTAESFKCQCPRCKTEMNGENIIGRTWKKGGCSHNGDDIYVCPNCMRKSERRAMGIPYNYHGVHDAEWERC